MSVAAAGGRSSGKRLFGGVLRRLLRCNVCCFHARGCGLCVEKKSGSSLRTDFFCSGGVGVNEGALDLHCLSLQ